MLLNTVECGGNNFLQGDSQWLTLSKPASAPVRQKAVVS